ncbi:Putative acyl-CoA dehydrogenase [Mycobacteroides abscessus]|nr:Putative acyl-CoA dehydrogenase [Mycobacteroides abscessus]CPS62486.1 Putative acyl-CoA dehydrogenase [Mycobacteroides abscessus]CPY44941.1 Putative acyl-CoA dehydrogenase [Mycobacteroides abscessus]CPY52734.1 Putative acyl-CoA dehydrogenase [Mycobacteroides abscessus]
MDFAPSARAAELIAAVREFIDAEVMPVERAVLAHHDELLGARAGTTAELWHVPPELDSLKAKARAAGLWNLFLPDPELGGGLSNSEYAPLAEQMGRSLFAPTVFNCNAPDSGNMEVLHRYGSQEQKEVWLEPLLEGDIRSAFCMTEPDVASSDATNMAATAVVEGDEVVINGRKWWSTGVGHPDCKVIIFMGLTDPNAHRYARHSMVLVPMDTPGYHR